MGDIGMNALIAHRDWGRKRPRLDNRAIKFRAAYTPLALCASHISNAITLRLSACMSDARGKGIFLWLFHETCVPGGEMAKSMMSSIKIIKRRRAAVRGITIA